MLWITPVHFLLRRVKLCLVKNFSFKVLSCHWAAGPKHRHTRFIQTLSTAIAACTDACINLLTCESLWWIHIMIKSHMTHEHVKWVYYRGRVQEFCVPAAPRRDRRTTLCWVQVKISGGAVIVSPWFPLGGTSIVPLPSQIKTYKTYEELQNIYTKWLVNKSISWLVN